MSDFFGLPEAQKTQREATTQKPMKFPGGGYGAIPSPKVDRLVWMAPEERAGNDEAPPQFGQQQASSMPKPMAFASLRHAAPPSQRKERFIWSIAVATAVMAGYFASPSIAPGIASLFQETAPKLANDSAITRSKDIAAEPGIGLASHSTAGGGSVNTDVETLLEMAKSAAAGSADPSISSTAPESEPAPQTRDAPNSAGMPCAAPLNALGLCNIREGN